MMRFRATGSLRTVELARFTQLTAQAFGVRYWTHAGRKVDMSRAALEQFFAASLARSPRPRAGVTMVRAPHGTSDVGWLNCGVGAVEYPPDWFRIDFRPRGFLKKTTYFRSAIAMSRPFEAAVWTWANEKRLNVMNRQDPDHTRPAILRWFHYMDEQLAESVGGVEHCLKTPCYKVERFCDGVLFQLTKEPFNDDDPHHREVQLRAMRHLGLED